MQSHPPEAFSPGATHSALQGTLHSLLGALLVAGNALLHHSTGSLCVSYVGSSMFLLLVYSLLLKHNLHTLVASRKQHVWEAIF